MAYNSPFPLTYQPAQIYYPTQSNASSVLPTQQPTPNNSIIWVQGEASAKSYLVAPNTTVQLWDSEEPVIYLKSADASGMPNMKIIDYTVREPNSPSKEVSLDGDKYISREELNGIQAKIDALQDDIDKMKRTKKKKEVDENE